MGVMLDSSVLVAAERGRLELPVLLARFEDEAVVMSVISASELLHGLHRAESPTRRAVRAAFLDAVLARLPVVPVDLPVARTHARLAALLRADGRGIGAHDLLIAATALTHAHSLATASVREFERVPGLRVETWLPTS